MVAIYMSDTKKVIPEKVAISRSRKLILAKLRTLRCLIDCPTCLLIFLFACYFFGEDFKHPCLYQKYIHYYWKKYSRELIFLNLDRLTTINSRQNCRKSSYAKIGTREFFKNLLYVKSFKNNLFDNCSYVRF